MNTWTKAFIVCLGLLAIASRADDTIKFSFSQARETPKTSYEQLASDTQSNKPHDLEVVRKIRREFYKK